MPANRVAKKAAQCEDVHPTARARDCTKGRNMFQGESAVSSEHELYPLSKFCCYDGAELPSYRLLTSADLPEPYNGLLNHTRDMTSVLQEFHGQNIHLENVQLRRDKDQVLRMVVLTTEAGRAVEFGAIAINLPPLPEEAQRDILACIIPFGAILNHHGVGYLSQPKGFIEIHSNDLIGEALKMDTPAKLYGRMNVLRSTTDEVLARVVEILPLAREED